MNRTWLLGVVGALLMAGCGGPAADPNRPQTVAVSGTVTYKGSPVEGATVTFLSDSREGKGAVGKTDASGRFTLMTFAPGDGAVPGTYKVTVRKTETQGGVVSEEEANKYLERGQNPPAPTVKDLLPEKYNSPQTSGLTAEVAQGGENDFKFELTD
jgi:hypothetical protein